MVKSSSKRKKVFIYSKNARWKYLSPCLLSFEKRSFPDSTLQATWLVLHHWGESRVSTSNWTAAVWVTLSYWMGRSWDLRSSKRQRNLTNQLLHERSTTIATKTNTNNSMDDLDRLLDEAEMVYSTATSKKKTSLKVNKEESEDSLNDDVSRYKPPPTTTVLFFFLFSESWRSSITSQQDLHNKNLCQ